MSSENLTTAVNSSNSPQVEIELEVKAAATSSQSKVIPLASSSSPLTTINFIQDVLGFARTVTLNSLTALDFSGKATIAPPVEIRIEDVGPAVCVFKMVRSGRVAYGHRTVEPFPVFDIHLFDPDDHILMTAKPAQFGSVAGSKSFQLYIQQAGVDCLFGEVNSQSSLSTGLHYDASHSYEVGVGLGSVTNLELQAESQSLNCCCCSTNKIQFAQRKGQDGLVVGELKRLPSDPMSSKGGHSQLTFQNSANLEPVIKLWMLFIAWHIHYNNFTKAPCSRNGLRGYKICVINIVIIVISIICITGAVIALWWAISTTRTDCFWTKCGEKCPNGTVEERKWDCKRYPYEPQIECCPILPSN